MRNTLHAVSRGDATQPDLGDGDGRHVRRADE